jgi:hypothetical protein
MAREGPRGASSICRPVKDIHEHTRNISAGQIERVSLKSPSKFFYKFIQHSRQLLGFYRGHLCLPQTSWNLCPRRNVLTSLTVKASPLSGDEESEIRNLSPGFGITTPKRLFQT